MVFDNQKQAELLTTEINCLRWARALMGLVYEFLDTQVNVKGPPPAPIPRLGFVSVSLAVGVESPRETFLLEEVIDTQKDGKFMKYISNIAAKPIEFPKDAERARIATFLAFCQHVQYLVTAKSAFVSDFQGSSFTSLILTTLLTHIDCRWSHLVDRSPDYHQPVRIST